ncbi:McrB family protein [Pseudarthrobacter quantipunctorum]|uniref:AAA+ ATPase domain-containing protein n=1 Tax=Pseudarthrobacter quantipunctorum TaxID=3128980 RepID=A0ABZ2R1K6_9MICC
MATKPSVGSANSARILKNAFKAGIPNLATRSNLKRARDHDRPWAWASKIIPAGLRDSELYIALIFKGQNLHKLEERLEEIEARARNTSRPPTNNTRFLLHASGFYATVLPEADSIDPLADPAGYGAPIPVDEIVYADVEVNGQLTSQEVDVIRRLRRDYSNPEKIVRLEENGVVEATMALPHLVSIDRIERAVADLGGHFSKDVLETYHLNTVHNPRKHFVILRGISGTGKSRLAKCYAYAVLGLEGLDAVHDRFTVIPVEPHWTDPSFLIGHEDVLASDGYRRTAFLEAILLACSDPLQPVFVLLDEMNRAQVEHYFSNMLSVMEIEGNITLHANPTKIKKIPTTIPWPHNLYITGTVNDDESVIPFSPMVLDRANSQDLSSVDVRGYGNWLRRREPNLEAVLTSALLDELASLADILAPFQLHFGNRTIREIAMYAHGAEVIKASVDPIDRQIDQKVLPKLRGGPECINMLESLEAALASRPQSRLRVRQMRSDLELTDYFKYR